MDVTAKQLYRTETTAVYERSDGYYEVFIIKIGKPQQTAFGLSIDDYYERYPSNRDFGKSAWTCMTLERAIEKYGEISK